MDIFLIVVEYLLPLIASVLTVVIAAGAKRLFDKWGIERSQTVDAMIDDYAKKGVDYAEVMGRKYLADNNAKISSRSKMSHAVGIVMRELKQAGITNVAEELVVGRIEYWLESTGKQPGVPSLPELTVESA